MNHPCCFSQDLQAPLILLRKQPAVCSHPSICAGSQALVLQAMGAFASFSGTLAAGNVCRCSRILLTPESACCRSGE